MKKAIASAFAILGATAAIAIGAGSGTALADEYCYWETYADGSVAWVCWQQ